MKPILEKESCGDSNLRKKLTFWKSEIWLQPSFCWTWFYERMQFWQSPFAWICLSPHFSKNHFSKNISNRMTSKNKKSKEIPQCIAFFCLCYKESNECHGRFRNSPNLSWLLCHRRYPESKTKEIKMHWDLINIGLSLALGPHICVTSYPLWCAFVQGKADPLYLPKKLGGSW